MKNIIFKLALSLALLLTFAYSKEVEAATTYKTCKELNKVYEHGVKDKKDRLNTVTNRKTKIQSTKSSKATFNLEVYKSNIKLDTDSDGIACEK